MVGLRRWTMSQKGKTRCPPIIVIVALILFLLSLPSAQAAPLWTEYGTVTARIEDVRYEESIYENQTHTRTYYTIKIIYFHDFKDNFKTDRASRGDVIEGLVMGPNSDLDCEEGEYITTDLVYFQDEWNAHWDHPLCSHPMDVFRCLQTKRNIGCVLYCMTILPASPLSFPRKRESSRSCQLSAIG